jgi:hypothetical protein
MYTVDTVNDDDDDDQSDDSNLEGYLERLPPGKKKSTIWNSWKRQYFVAKNGLLLIFGDNTRQVIDVPLFMKSFISSYCVHTY